MKKTFLVVLLASLISCSDGDLQIETLDFDSASLDQCGTAGLTTDLFFKINQEEALILELPADLFLNEISTETISRTIPSQAQLTYRVFNDNVSNSYFCSDFPPATPIVTEEIEADSGTVLVTTTQEDDTTFRHTIQLDNIQLVNAAGERITDLTINEFGSFTTTVSN
ncbi:hypothetical protein [Croceivirga thetidis]|uniref:Uncharacterized protein n=1 Tax=Croceivirga thetidis TaxID=2721623 RepID=A0ABX1GVV0_9FLAO|nr:hypothetical protein [Croceivirga thetidis]NKI32862.1 hypothetical protein [Croceivirga thetidis]